MSGVTARQRWRDAIRDSDDPAIDAYTRAVAFALDRHMSGDGQTYTGVRRLGQLAGVDKGTAANRVDRLVELGWLERSTAGRGHPTEYQVSVPTGQSLKEEVSGPSPRSVRPQPQSVRPHRTDPVLPRIDPEGTHTHTPGGNPRVEETAPSKRWDIDRVVEATSNRLHDRDRDACNELPVYDYFLTEAFENMLAELGYLNEAGNPKANIPKSLRYEIKTKCDAVNAWLDGSEDVPPVIAAGIRKQNHAVRQAKKTTEREAAQANAPACPQCGKQHGHLANDHRWGADEGLTVFYYGGDPPPSKPKLQTAADVWRERYQPKSSSNGDTATDTVEDPL